MRDSTNRYALAVLKDKRATLASEIVHLERQIRARKDSLAHVDATLKLLDPSIETGSIPNKRLSKRIRLFRQGELGRLILGALRSSERPLRTAEIVSAILSAGGHGESARATVAPRVRGNLAYLERRGKVEKISVGLQARWRLNP